MKLLIIEDEPHILRAISKGFRAMGYTVEQANDGNDAIDAFYSSVYDLVILDLNLPGCDGLEVLKEIRKENAQLPVLILSARAELEDKILGLDLGANDFLSKPFHFKELEARVRALIRNRYGVASSKIPIGDQALGLVLDVAKKIVYHHQTELPLTKKEYSILEALCLAKGHTLSAEQLIDHVWDNSADPFSGAIKVHLSTLRKKLPAGVLHNVRGQGYYVE